MRYFLLFTLAAVAGGCASKAGGSATPLTADTFATGVTQTYCHLDATCGHPAYSSEAACIKASGPSTLAASVAAGRAKFDASQAQACLDAIAVCSGTTTAPPACVATLTGTVAEGGACTGGEECATANSVCNSCKCKAMAADGAACTTSSDCYNYNCQSGKCVAPPTVPKLGEICEIQVDPNTVSTVGCDTGLYCDTTSKKCAAYLASGAACKDWDACAAGLVCATDATGAGTCKTTPKVGEACSSGSANPCGYFDVTCVGTTGAQTCQPYVYLGDACVPNQCNSGLTCDPTSKKCINAPAAGTACTDSSQCGDGGYCNNSKCMGSGATTCS